MPRPALLGARFALAHAPHLVRYGSKPARVLVAEPQRAAALDAALRPYAAAVGYPPHQVLLGNLAPATLWSRPQPWYEHPLAEARSRGPDGELVDETTFYGMLRAADDFDLVLLDPGTAASAQEALATHPLLRHWPLDRLARPAEPARIAALVAHGAALALPTADGCAGCLRRDHEDDETLAAPVLLENLAAKATAALALAGLGGVGLDLAATEYVIGCGEEAVGDRYQRGGGSLGKAVAELAGLRAASGADVKAFCCGPTHALVVAASLVQAGVYRQVAVVGGCSLAKLGMKFLGHLAKGLPVLEDVLAAFAAVVGPDDGQSPLLRLDAVGRVPCGAGSGQQALLEALTVQPLAAIGLRLCDVDRYATELHNPEITLPAGSGDVPRTNYRALAGLAVLRGEIGRGEVETFVRQRGLPGFAPTQGHVASAVPYLAHARRGLIAGDLRRVLFMAKGSLFLGRMTRLADGLSFLLERNPGLPAAGPRRG